MRKGEKSAARRLGTRNWIGNPTLGGEAIFADRLKLVRAFFWKTCQDRVEVSRAAELDPKFHRKFNVSREG